MSKTEQRNLRLRLLSYLVILYMLVAFAWWSYLLFVKNEDAFLAKCEYAKLSLIAESKIKNNQEFYETDIYKNLRSKYKRQEWMIFGEASVFVLSLIIGVWLINRGYNREMRAAQQRRNFLLSITHELKSPIASIKLVLETFLKRNLEKNQTQQLSQNALNDTNRLNNLVSNLLLAAKLENAYIMDKESLNIVQILQDIVISLLQNNPDTIIDLETDTDIVMIHADKMGMTSVFTNLLENAVKYSLDSPKIVVEISETKENVVVSIKDEGVGIPNIERERIFERFYRIGNEDTRRAKGTGLGLYIVKQIIEAHKGRVDVKSNSPKGSIFIVKL